MQSFDRTYCCWSDVCKAKCVDRLLPETVEIVPEYRGISMADLRTETCGFKERK